jgi:hypothetical protein
VGESAAELVHVGLMVMQMAGTLDVFINTVFNVPTLSETYKYAAYDGLSRLERRQRGQRNGMGLREISPSTRDASQTGELPQVLEAPHALT